MKYLFLTYFMLPVLCAVSGCSTSRSVVRTGSAPIVSQITTGRGAGAYTQPSTYMKIEKDSTSYFIVPDTSESGELIMNLDEITVYSRSRTLPERNGKVSVDFRVSVPKSLLGNARSIVVSPVLHLENEKRPLTEIVIRGALFDKVQNRNYWQYYQFFRTFRPDSAAEMWAYRRFIRNPMPEGVRMDSIVNRADHFDYYYMQEIPSDETSLTMLITLDTFIKGLDGTSAGVRATDTLRYNISSVLSFADTTTRYRQKIVERKAYLRDKRFIAFHVNDWRIDESLENNHSELVAIEDMFTDLLSNKEFDVESIRIVAGSSPDGAYSHNENLARLRAGELKKYLTRLFGREISPLLQTGWIAEDWPALEEMIRSDTAMLDNRDEILKIIANHKDPDRRESVIRNRYSKDYQVMKDEFYPRLRSVSFTYELARKGMVQDTIITSEVDETYMQGLDLLMKRKYEEALEILAGYRDVNTAVCLLSMGEDGKALDILTCLPIQGTTAYMLAIAYSRLGYRDEGRKWFLEALNFDPRYEYRARLDPEIYELLKL